MALNLQKAEFLISVADVSRVPSDGKPQIVFAGKSNVGKSSVINKLLLRKNFARVGEQPGKTVHINYFKIDGKAYFVDLPGYGYAKVPQAEKERWGKLMESFFSLQNVISLGIMIVDARHKPTQNDIVMAEWFQNSGCPFLVVANKLDKLKNGEIAPNMQQIRETLSLSENCKLIPFSAEKGTGRQELLSEILRYADPE